MESDIVHQRLNNLTDTGARNILVCYLQYLMDYRRDVPDMDEHVISELQRLLSTKYVKQLNESDPIWPILQSADQLEAADAKDRKHIWSLLSHNVSILK